VVQILIDFKAPLNPRNKAGQTPAYLAAAAGQEGVLETLWRADADLEQHAADGTTPVLSAARNGHAKAVSILQMAGADLDAVGEGGCAFVPPPPAFN
jgi:ankyrin repeat protein